MKAIDYHAHFGLSSSGLRYARMSARHWKAWFDEEQKTTAAMRLGTLVHGLVLEPEVIEKEIAVWTGVQRKGKEWTSFQANNPGKLIMNQKEIDEAKRLADSILGHAPAMALLKGGRSEVSFIGNDPLYGAPIKGRFDYLRPDLVVDIKTTNDTCTKFAEKGYFDNYYHLQAPWYTWLASLIDGRKRAFAWIVVEKEGPREVQIVCPEDEVLEYGAEQNEIALQNFAAAYHSGEWTGYQQDILTAGLPGWIKFKYQRRKAAV